MNTHVTVSDMRLDVSKMHNDVSIMREEIGGRLLSVSVSCIQSTDNKGALTVS